MGTYFKALDRFAASMAGAVIKHRISVILLSVILAVAAGTGMARLDFSTNYRVFFSDANPELQAFEDLQNTYTKNDNFFFVLESVDGQAFSPQTLAAVERLTNEAWQIPYAIRVDSLSNFQHSHAVDDDLIVEDLVTDALSRETAYLEERQAVSLAEPLLRDQLITSDGEVTAVNVVLQYPQKKLEEVPEAVDYARNVAAQIEADYPGIEVHLTGVSMLNNAFAETGLNDAATLMPLMFVVIFLLSWFFVRSFTATLSTLLIITLSTVIGMGVAGFAGVKLTPVSMSAPVVILTLAVADSVHILLALKSLLREGQQRTAALIEAVRVNFLPVTITSLTTIVGFLALNFSDSPPYWHLGNITAIGIAAAWLYSLTLLPALLSTVSVADKPVAGPARSQQLMDRLAELVIGNHRRLLGFIGAGLAVAIAFIPTLEFNDQWVEYFDDRIEFRTDSDAAQEHFGLYPIEFSVPANGPGGVSEPEYLSYLDEFAAYLRARSNVTHVYSLSDIMKRLNRNMHGDDPSHYRLPDDRELSAQYLLLYELSLPYGLDLNDRINIDKSATRVTATLTRARTAENKAFFENAARWQEENWPEYMRAEPTSAAVMFTYISERNLDNMISGTIIAILAIAVIMMIALRSAPMGLLSMVPNGLPILATFGAWALIVGDVGFSVATVASISLGIIVDDTVHFLTKYVRGRDERNLTVRDAIRYAFHSVGIAIIVNTIILSAGFLVMTTSAFKMNVDLGLMTVLAIGFALILDFLLLPALLLALGERNKSPASITALPEPGSA